MTSPTFSTPRTNHAIVLNGSNNSFVSMRIEDPKKASPTLLSSEDDVFLKMMLVKIPQVSQYFHIVDKLGEGTFSKVYKARLKRPYRNNSGGNNSSVLSDSSSSSSSDCGSSTPTTNPTSPYNDVDFALKYIIPIVRPSRIAKELRFLRDLRGVSNIIPIRECFWNAGHTVLVMPIMEHDKFLDYFQRMDIGEVREYMRNLLIALERVHMLDIIHRDIKPANFLYNRTSRKYALVDFGLSQSQRELDNARNYLQHELLPLKKPVVKSKPTITTTIDAKNEVKVVPSKVRANLTYRFTKNCLILDHHAPKSSSATNKAHQSTTITTTASSMASTISLVKAKRTFDEIEQQHKPTETPTETANNKRARFIAAECSSIFATPITPTNNNEVFVPATPPSKLPPLTAQFRVPLGDHDSNRRDLATFTSSLPVMNLALAFTTPPKTEFAAIALPTQVNRTPVKGLASPMCIPETPPKTAQKNLLFQSSAPKVPTTKFVTNAKENLIVNATTTTNTAHHNNYLTPKTRTVSAAAAFKKAHKKILQPELANIGGGTTTKPEGSPTICDCLDAAHICYDCLSKPELNVPRAGTPGFRAPEILLRCQAQSTKIDMWSTGVIFISLLSGRYPFFRCMDDMTCLSEIVTILGSSKVKRAAAGLGKIVRISHKRPAMNLKHLCERLRQTLEEASTPDEVYQGFKAPDSAYDLLAHLLDPNPATRFSAVEALAHPFFSEPLSLDLIAG